MGKFTMNKNRWLILLLVLLLPSGVFAMSKEKKVTKKVTRKQAARKKAPKRKTKLPIVFHPKYDISFYGVEKLHPFDSKKYGKAFQYLKDNAGITDEQVVQPDMITEVELLQVHSQDYLDTLDQPTTVAEIAEMPILGYVPQCLQRCLLQNCLLVPMKYATKGTILAAELAIKKGWAINLSGGYHHAKADSGGGFCFFADIPLAIYYILDNYDISKVLIVDLDAHQGNGHESVCGEGKYSDSIDIFDMYNGQIYPNDKAAQKFITYKHPVKSGIRDKEYLGLLRTKLPEAIEKSKPDILVYNAGTDPLAGDPLGRMNISEKGMIERDEIVFRAAGHGDAEREEPPIPVVMVLSGGYTKQSARLIGKSTHNILSNVLQVRGIRRYH